MDKQTYNTQREALAKIKTMRGWHARPIRLYLDDDRGDQWVIQCDHTLYLRLDGYVR